jgi:hypothetical protein
MRNKLLLIVMVITLTIQMTTAQVPSYVPTNGLVAYFPFNGNANDYSGNNHNGVVHGNVVETIDRYGNINAAYKWQSSNYNSNDYIDIGYLFNKITNKITISTWVLLDCAQTNHRIISTGEQGLICYQVQNDLIKLKAAYDSAGGVWPSNQFINKNEWHYLVFTADAITGISNLYIDGQLTDTVTGFTIGNLSTEIWNIGRKSTSGFDGFCGKIDDMCLYNRVLTQEEVTNLYYSENSCQTLVINTGILSFNPPTYNNSVTIYPNPTNDQITIDCGNLANVSGWTIKIVNTVGQEVFSGAMNTQQYVVPLNSWSGQGIYFVKIYDASNNLINTKKIILQ